MNAMLKNMQLFVEVARAKSFRRAADVLGMPNSTVSRRISELERDVGLRLFNRTTRQVEMTDVGRAYFESCERIIAEAQAAHQALVNMQAQPSGVIRVSMPVDFGVVYLSPLMADFAALYPLIQFDLDLNPGMANLLGDSVDISIRMSQPKEQNVIARNIANLTTGLFASPDYLEKKGIPLQPQDLKNHECLRMREAPWILRENGGQASQTVAVSGQFIANSIGLLRALALDGKGIMMNSEIMVHADCVAQRLVRVLPEWQMPTVEVYALTATRLLPAKVRSFIDYLVARMPVSNVRG
jgi:DNA-binding transcriptional LysR family regulator